MKRCRSIPALFALASILAAFAAPSLASGGAVPIYQVPVTIDQPGSYYLSRDLSGAGGAALITIAASRVTLDLAGHTLERTDSSGDVIGWSGQPGQITIRNGTVIGGYHGVSIGNYAGTSFDVRIEGLTVQGAAGDGIHVESGYEVAVPTHVVIAGNMVSDAAGRGIYLFALDAGRVSGNVVRASGQSGILVEASTGVFVRGNDVADSGDHGVELLNSSACAIDNNHIARSGQYGCMFDGTPSSGSNCYIANRLLDNASGPIGRQNETQYESLPCSDNPT